MPDLTPDEEDLVDRSPTLEKLVKRGRLAPSRLQDLLQKAASKKPPAVPEAWECCGSSCRPCVREVWREERKVWDEVHPDGVSDDEGEEEEKGEEGEKEEKKKDAGKPRVEIGVEEEVEKLSLEGEEKERREDSKEEGEGKRS